jgi:hypothetical protein
MLKYIIEKKFFITDLAPSFEFEFEFVYSYTLAGVKKSKAHC